MEEIKGVGFDEPTAPDSLPKGKKLLVAIGINTYQSKYWKQLNNAVRDVEAVASILRNQYDFDEVIWLKDGKATKSNIEQELHRLTDPAVLGPHDSLLVYYSGHGHLDKNERGYWVPVDAERLDAKTDRISTYLANSRIRELIADLKCKHVLFISDACFAGTLFVKGGRGSGPQQLFEEYEKRVSRWAFCSGRHDEQVSDGKPGGHSPFAAAILQELMLNKHQKLHIARLADKVIEITRANYQQMPEANPIQDAGHKGGQFVFTPKDYVPIDPIPPDPVSILVPKPVSGWLTRRATLIGMGILLVMALGWAVCEIGHQNYQKPMTTLLLLNHFISPDTIEYGKKTQIIFKIKNTGTIAAQLDTLNFSTAGLTILENDPAIIAPDGERTFRVEWHPDSLGMRIGGIRVQGENLATGLTISETVFVQPRPVPPPPPREKRMVNIETDIPVDVEMWLEAKGYATIYAKKIGEKLFFVVPRALVNQHVTIYFKRNDQIDHIYPLLARENIILPDNLKMPQH